MDNTKNNLVGALLTALLVFIGWCFGAFHWRDYVPEGAFWTFTLVTGSSLSLFAWLVVWRPNAVQNQVYLNVKPNLIEIPGAEHFCGEYSSDSRFLVSKDAFQKTLEAVVLRKSYTKGRFMFAREAAHVRIWPGAIGITDLELEAICKVMAAEFIAVEVEVLEDSQNQRSLETAIKA